VPELEAAREKWTDDYCVEQFDHTMQELRATPAQGTFQRSNSVELKLPVIVLVKRLIPSKTYCKQRVY
jgi:hypothetical protein